MTELSSEHNRLSGLVVDSAFAVHRELGAGLLESVYEECLGLELQARGVPIARQVSLPFAYRGVTLEGGFRIDIIVADLIVVEVKAVEHLQPIHDAQLLTYLKLSGRQLGLLINFNVPRIRDGIKRFVRTL
jgi:GxxExxY protein